MSTDITAFDDVLDERTKGKAEYGVSARRKVQLSSYDAPLHVLDAHGIEVPHKDFNPEDAHTYPTTHVFEDGTRVHLHQNVREQNEEVFGDFGNATEDTDDVVWTVVDLTEETVTLTVVGDWGQRREVPFEDFPEQYEPLTADMDRYVPQWGY